MFYVSIRSSLAVCEVTHAAVTVLVSWFHRQFTGSALLVALTAETSGQKIANVITVPQLAIVPIPFIRVSAVHVPVHAFPHVSAFLQVAECTVEFNAKLSSVTASESSNMRSSSTTRTESLGFWFVSMSSTSSYSNKVTEKNSNKEERMFSITVRVNAKQDDMPNGMKKILDMLEAAMIVQ